MLPVATGISVEGMQTIAREFNFGETTFVTPPGDAANSRRVRIFTPKAELPFAGAPTVGTACALVLGGHVAGPEPLTLQLEQGVGVVTVDVKPKDHTLSAMLTLAFKQDRIDRVPAVDLLASSLSLQGCDVLQGFQAGIGVEFSFIQLASRAAVDRAALHTPSWVKLCAAGWSPHLFLFAGDLLNGSQLYARMFAPTLGIVEDPATGSACAGLVGAAATGSTDGTFQLTVVQGVAMGRPSEIEALASVVDGKVASVGVGGATAFVAQGEIEVPARFLLT